ncbi:MAG: DNA topoisomerase 3 [Clostridia bacterium]
MTRLVIAEKPSVGSAIAKVLGATTKKDGYYEGNGHYVTWCVGHLVELAVASKYNADYSKWNYENLPIIPQKFEYSISQGKEKQMKIIGELMKKSDVDEIVCATDAGREGELIFRLVYNKLNCKKPVKRLWISSLEDEAIRNGFSNLHDCDGFENLYQSALCRTKADWIVGINATRLFSVLYGQTLNIGRVMSPTLAMIVERNASVETFKSEPFYTVELQCDGFVLTGEKIKSKEQAERVKSDTHMQNLVIQSIECKEITEKPPKLYDLTTLQREANKILGFTANQTLEYTQSLYEKKLCTYPRTDSRFLTEDMKLSVTEIAKACTVLFMPKDSNIHMDVSQVIDNKKVSDHHAIIPTIKVEKLDLGSLPMGEREILKLIAMRLLVSIGENHVFSETVITGKCAGTIFRVKGKTITKYGFKNVQKLYANSDENAEKPLPTVSVGDEFLVKSEIKQGKTTPPKNYTDDTLLQAMENANKAEVDAEMKGIGTPATRAGILEKLIKTGFVERKGEKKAKRFVPTHKGIALITVLPEVIKSPLLTAKWEEKLKQIELGELDSETFLSEISQMINELVKTYEVVKNEGNLFPKNRESVGVCPRCGSPVTENAKGFCCSDRACGFAIWKQNKFFENKKKTVSKAVVKDLLSKGVATLKGCYSIKTGKSYDCVVFLNNIGGKFVEFKMEFDKK